MHTHGLCVAVLACACGTAAVNITALKLTQTLALHMLPGWVELYPPAQVAFQLWHLPSLAEVRFLELPQQLRGLCQPGVR